MKIKALIFVSILVVSFLLYNAIAPWYRIVEIERMENAESSELKKYEEFAGDPGIDSLILEKSYLGALLVQSEFDSIQLAVSLADSSFSIILNGVRIHTSRIHSYEADRIFNNMRAIQRAKLFSKPLETLSERATIEKEPVVIRHAPSDTSEVSDTNWVPDTLQLPPVYFTLNLEHGIQLCFEQNNDRQFKSATRKLMFHFSDRLIKLSNSVFRFFTLKSPVYHPVITIRADAGELRSAYRALSSATTVVVKL